MHFDMTESSRLICWLVLCVGLVGGLGATVLGCGEDDVASAQRCVDRECEGDQTCYQGACRDLCERTVDCEADERCHNGHCLPADCDVVDCADDQSCFGGVCHPECSTDRDCPDSEHLCVEEACVTPDCEMEGAAGAGGCPGVLSPDVEITSIGTDSAQLEGELLVEPVALTDHGFCLSTAPDPTVDPDNCESLGEPEEAGAFSMEAEGLEPATDYYVQSYVGVGDVRYGSPNANFTTRPPAPTGLETAGFVDHVHLEWDYVPGVGLYRVIRDPGTADEEDLGVTAGTDFRDDGADGGNVEASPPQNLAVTDGAKAVELEWEPPSVEGGDPHEYVVVAIAGGAESAPSPAATGHRLGAQVQRYEVGTDDGWIDVGDVTEWADEDAPAGDVDIDESSIEIAEAEDLEVVSLAADAATPVAGPDVDYRVRAITKDEEGAEVEGEPTEPETGHRYVADVTHQWQFASAFNPAAFYEVPGCGTDVLECGDEYGQPPEHPRWYRLEISAPGLGEPVYAPEPAGRQGWVAVQGDVETLEPAGITHEEAMLRGELVEPGVPAPDELGFCWDEAPDGSPTHGDAEECIELDSVSDDPGQFDQLLEDLDYDTTYTVSAFVHTPDVEEAGYDYGEPVSFTTDAPPPCDPEAATFSGGDGSTEKPYTICNADDLDSITMAHYNDHFIVMDDIDMTDVGHTPIGEQNWHFTGVFDGNGKTIEGLEVSGDTVGLFGVIGAEGSVEDLHLENFSITGGDSVGAVVGINIGTIRDVSVDEDSEVEGNDQVGGVVGRNSGAVWNSRFDGNASGTNQVGGLVGILESGGSVTESAVTAGADVTGGDEVGGLVGRADDAMILESEAHGVVAGEDGRFTGGLVGQVDSGEIHRSYATGSVNGDTSVGGLVGRVDYGGEVHRSHATGSVDGNRDVGGLAGGNRGEIHRSHATGSVEGGDYNIGGLVGWMNGKVTESYATGNVDGGNQAGGLVGYNTGQISGSYSSGHVTGGASVGGLVGRQHDDASGQYSYWDEVTSSQYGSAAGTGLTTDQFNEKDNFSGWDFESIWELGQAPDGHERPILQWQN